VTESDKRSRATVRRAVFLDTPETKKHRDWFVKGMRKYVEANYPGMNPIFQRVAEHLKVTAQDCAASCVHDFRVKHYEVTARVKPLDSIVRKWGRIAKELQSLTVDELKSDRPHKLLEMPLVEGHILQVKLYLVAANLIAPVRRPKSILTMLLDELYDNPLLSFVGLDDLVGVRIVVHNLADLERLHVALRARLDRERAEQIERMRKTHPGQSLLEWEVIEQNYICTPKDDGYRGVHFNFQWTVALEEQMHFPVPCEIQLRTHAQHLWSLLSRELLYSGADEAPALKKPAHARAVALAKLLSGVDDLASEIAEEAYTARHYQRKFRPRREKH
jgi:ppGpp synthetase/RelA/SpoT-type nucleotidyltranferase